MDAELPFFVVAPGGTDFLMLGIGIFLVVILLGLGALYFTVQAIPDRMASGSHKIQMQIVGILGVISLFTMNNAFWIAGILLAAIPFHELFPDHFARVDQALAEREAPPVIDDEPEEAIEVTANAEAQGNA
ncbi:MAG: hypothetical protein JXR15_10605 [Shimia sp.]|uniref:hypothetical protein n=1 Tax=Shimia sp. TaxID=1954381 RepID=UPI003B8D8C82